MATSAFVCMPIGDHAKEGTGLKIDEGFKFLIPPLTEEECKQLTQNILRNGCIDAISVWAGHDIILDGHTRYAICVKNGINYKLQPIELKSREDAINWIIDNQLGRRNITDSQKSYLRGKKYNTEKKLARGRPKNGDQNDHIKTSEKIALEEKVGSATVRRDAEFAKAIDCLKDDVGQDFGMKLLSGQIKLPKSDILKLAKKPADEKIALIEEIEKGARRLSQAESALKKTDENWDLFERCSPETQFAAWSWDPKKLDAPKNTHVPPEGCEIREQLVYLDSDIFEDSFTDEERSKVLQIMRESPQWVFMVHTKNLERLEEIDWPWNVWIGCMVDSQSSAEHAWKAFGEIGDTTKFVICDLHNESIAFDGLSAFNWIIIRNLSRSQPPWQRVESILEQALADSVSIYQMPNIRARPQDYPRLQEHKGQGSMLNVPVIDSIREVA